MADIVTWTGASGGSYKTELYIIGTRFKHNPGIYIFCKQDPQTRRWPAIYVGETDNFQRRLYDELGRHHRWPCIQREGATHVCVSRVDGGKEARKNIESDLKDGLDPPCNLQ